MRSTKHETIESETHERRYSISGCAIAGTEPRNYATSLCLVLGVWTVNVVRQRYNIIHLQLISHWCIFIPTSSRTSSTTLSRTIVKNTVKTTNMNIIKSIITRKTLMSLILEQVILPYFIKPRHHGRESPYDRQRNLLRPRHQPVFIEVGEWLTDAEELFPALCQRDDSISYKTVLRRYQLIYSMMSVPEILRCDPYLDRRHLGNHFVPLAGKELGTGIDPGWTTLWHGAADVSSPCYVVEANTDRLA